MHPNIVLSAIPMGLSMNAWEANHYEEVAKFLTKGVEQVKGVELISLFVRTTLLTLY